MTMAPSLMARVGISKGLGLLVGLVGFLGLSQFAPESDTTLRFGLLCWYVTLGAMVGLIGVWTWHPVLRLPMKWWLRSSILGAWFNFTLVLLLYPALSELMTSAFGAENWLASPYWIVLEGAGVAMAIDYVATRVAGEGEALLASGVSPGMRDSRIAP